MFVNNFVSKDIIGLLIKLWVAAIVYFLKIFCETFKNVLEDRSSGYWLIVQHVFLKHSIEGQETSCCIENPLNRLLNYCFYMLDTWTGANICILSVFAYFILHSFFVEGHNQFATFTISTFITIKEVFIEIWFLQWCFAWCFSSIMCWFLCLNLVVFQKTVPKIGSHIHNYYQKQKKEAWNMHNFMCFC